MIKCMDQPSCSHHHPAYDDFQQEGILQTDGCLD